ncbi:hypothetical protein [Fluviicola sp.]|uniref:hypothetical protein n=1 Tax=Fluviicola sp. TaxID=1917219 RepID=UPI0031D1DBAC
MENIALLYDEDCPLCRWYTRIFVKYRIIEPDGRISYNQYVAAHPNDIDTNIAQTKIACLNHQTNEVLYGIDGLVALLGKRFILVRILGNFKPINWLLKLLYLLFSYNRRIFAPVKKRNFECVACEPAKSLTWRIIFIGLMSYLTYLIVHWYFESFLTDYLVLNPVNDILLLLAQIGFQWLAFTALGQENSYDYLGHLVFTSFLGALALLVFGIGLKFLDFTGIHTDFLAVVCYGTTVAFMFFGHKRRLALKDWSQKLSLSWILFRLCIYPLVFQL